MHVIFADNKIIDPHGTSQQISLRNLPLAPQLPLRMSCSPQKMPIPKKFFFPMRNQSSRQEETKSKAELESAIRRDKIKILAQKTPFNELILTPDVLLREHEIVSFPSLEVKHVSWSQQKSPPRRAKERMLGEDVKLEDIKRDYRSNILDNLSAISQQMGQNHWMSEQKVNYSNITTMKQRQVAKGPKKTGSNSQS
jgi:hypothetical protein